jgi:hypothetical protein
MQPAARRRGLDFEDRYNDETNLRQIGKAEFVGISSTLAIFRKCGHLLYAMQRLERLPEST